MEYGKRAVGHTQDWSDPQRTLEEIERATAAREQLTSGDGWFDKLVKPAADDAKPQDDTKRQSKGARRKAAPARRASRKDQ